MTTGMKLRPVATDKGIEGFAEAAQAALAADYGQAKGAITVCRDLLRRIAKRAADKGSEYFEIATTSGPTLSFNGNLLCEHEFDAGEVTRINIYFAIYETVGGALIAEKSTVLADGTGKEFINTAVVEPQDDVLAMRSAIMDFFEWDIQARSMAVKKLKWSMWREVA